MLQDPYILVYAFFDATSPYAQIWHAYVKERFEKHLELAEKRPEIFHHQLQLYDKEDALIVFVAIECLGSHSTPIWRKLHSILFGADGVRLPTGEGCWGITVIFGGLVEEEQAADKYLLYLNDLSQLLGNYAGATPLHSNQSWGRLWLVQHPRRADQISPQIYMVLPSHKQEVLAHQFLLTENGFNLVEASLHKAYQQFDIYQHYCAEWKEAVPFLDKALDEALQNMHKHQLLESSKLTLLSLRYAEFFGWLTRLAELHNTIETNYTNYRYTSTDFGFLHEDDQIFRFHMRKLEQAVAQLAVDRRYYEAAVARLDVGLQTVRTNLELALVEAERVSRDEARRQGEQADRRDFLIAMLGLLLGFTQLWPLIQERFQLLEWQSSSRLIANGVALLCFGVLVSTIIVWWFINHHRNRE